MNVRTVWWIAAAALLLAAPVAAQGGPPPHVRAAIAALVEMIEGEGRVSLEQFADARLTPEYRASFGAAGPWAHLAAVREHARSGGDDLSVERERDGSLVLTLGGPGGPRLGLRLDDDGLFEDLRIVESSGTSETPGRAAAVDRHAVALETTASMDLDEAVRVLSSNHLSRDFRASLTPEALRALVARVRDAAASAGAVMMDENAEGVHLVLRSGGGGHRVTFRVEPETPFPITSLRVEPLEADDVQPLVWDELESWLEELQSEGFGGTVIARRDGRTVLREAYGVADRSTGRPNTADLAFGLGSTPIDFTITLALIFHERGVIDLDEPISAHFDDVPADKASLTPRMILDRRSGLPDFFHTAEDWDPDLAWVDRDEAVRRIFGQRLRFAPGTDEGHSHGAYVLLSALLEVATGTPYRTLVRQEILDPLGMERTGFYGESRGLGAEDFASGHGASSVGVPNIPPNWGPTSWLIMGSGGMWSTADDMERYYQALLAGELLAGPEAERQRGRKAGIGGSDRGYFFLRVQGENGDSLMLLSNTEGGLREGNLMQRVFSLVWGEVPGPIG